MTLVVVTFRRVPPTRNRPKRFWRYRLLNISTYCEIWWIWTLLIAPGSRNQKHDASPIACWGDDKCTTRYIYHRHRFLPQDTTSGFVLRYTHKISQVKGCTTGACCQILIKVHSEGPGPPHWWEGWEMIRNGSPVSLSLVASSWNCEAPWQTHTATNAHRIASHACPSICAFDCRWIGVFYEEIFCCWSTSRVQTYRDLGSRRQVILPTDLPRWVYSCSCLVGVFASANLERTDRLWQTAVCTVSPWTPWCAATCVTTRLEDSRKRVRCGVFVGDGPWAFEMHPTSTL